MNKMVIFRENVFKKGLLTFFNKHLFLGKTFLKRFLTKTDLSERDLKTFFSFHKGYRCFQKYTRVMKSYKIFLIFLQQKL